jgi:hypothetical protein
VIGKKRDGKDYDSFKLKLVMPIDTVKAHIERKHLQPNKKQIKIYIKKSNITTN